MIISDPKTRICYNGDIDDISGACPTAASAESEVCGTADCPAVPPTNPTDPIWLEWAAWSECSASCGYGSVSRNRQCQRDENIVDSTECTGDAGPVLKDCENLPVCELTCEDVTCTDPNSFCEVAESGPQCVCRFPFDFNVHTEKCVCNAWRPFDWQCIGKKL
jgi:hypothetical protein